MTARRRHWTLKAVDLSGSVYGTVLASSILVALGYKSGNALVMIAVLAATELVFTFAHAWSAVMSAGTERGAWPPLADIRRELQHEWPTLQASGPAIIALSLAAVGVYSTDAAINIALVTNAAILFLWGFVLGRLHGSSRPLSVAVGAVTCGLGLILVFLKVLVH